MNDNIDEIPEPPQYVNKKSKSSYYSIHDHTTDSNPTSTSTPNPNLSSAPLPPNYIQLQQDQIEKYKKYLLSTIGMTYHYQGLPAVVVDCGSTSIKYGYAGEDIPHILPFTLKTYKDLNMEIKDIDKYRPITRGFINDFSIIGNFIEHIMFDELQLPDVGDNPLLIVGDNVHKSKLYRQKITEICFEQFSVPAFYLCLKEVCSLYASGRTTGHIINFGEEYINFLNIYEGYALPNNFHQSLFGGKQITSYLMKLLKEKISNLNKINDLGVSEDNNSKNGKLMFDYMNEMKEKLAYVTMDFEKEKKEFEKGGKLIEYNLPDGNVLKVGRELFECTELLFNPAANYLKKEMSIADNSVRVIKLSEIDVRESVGRDIVLSGGGSMFTGLKERLEMEIKKKNPYYQTKVNASPERKYYSWLGGSILGSLSTFQSMWISKEEYMESGKSIVDRKCF